MGENQEVRTRRTAAETRELVLQTAHDLFYWHGIRATGVDKIAAEVGVAPSTLYRLFQSKDDLVAAYVERAMKLFQEWFTATADAGGTPPQARIPVVFDGLTEQVQPDRCRGCPFLMALAELPEPDLPGRRHAVAVKVGPGPAGGADHRAGGRRPGCACRPSRARDGGRLRLGAGARLRRPAWWARTLVAQLVDAG